MVSISMLWSINIGYMYHKVANSNTSRFEAPAGFFRVHMKRISDPYVLTLPTAEILSGKNVCALVSTVLH